MSTHSVLPQYVSGYIPMKGTSVRVTQDQYNALDKLTRATHSPTTAKALRLCIKEELSAVQSGQRTKEAFICVSDRKPFTFTFKLSDTDKQALSELMDFYGVKTYSDIVCHVIAWNLRLLDAEKAGE